jgi:hypothetical protein
VVSAANRYSFNPGFLVRRPYNNNNNNNNSNNNNNNKDCNKFKIADNDFLLMVRFHCILRSTATHFSIISIPFY